jgi:hypothetical protein
VKAELPEELFSVVQRGIPALLLTVDPEGFPHTAFTFVATPATDSIAFVMDEGSTTQKNIERTKMASLQILARNNQVYLAKGPIRVSETKLKHSPAPSRRAIMELSSIRNQAWQQVRVAPLTYEYTDRAREWESALPHLYAELRGEE